MSVGIGAGDFIKVLELIHQARKSFADAPSQYDAISKDFYNVILDIDILSSEWEPDIEQREKVKKAADDSMCLFNDILAKLDKYRAIGANSTGMVQHAKKPWKRLNWPHDDIQDFQTRLSLHLELIGAVKRQIDSQRFSRMEQKTDHITERVDQQHVHEILGWYGTSDHGSRQSSLIEEHEEGTCEWYLASNEFRDWIKTKDQILFCPGLPGAGKAFLVSIVIQHLLNLFDKDNSTLIAYHYCDFGQQNNETVHHIFSSILKQFAQCLGSLPATMVTLYNEHKKKDTRPSLSEIASALKTVASLSSRTFIVIDGLDECLVWRNLMAQLKDLQGVNILATSREIPEIANDNTLEAKALEVRLPPSHDQQRQEEVRAVIIRASGGMFLLARLHLDSLARKISLWAFKDALTSLPTGASAYNKAYHDVMKRIESQDEERIAFAKDVLAWLAFAKRPLEELRTAVTIQETDLNVDEDKLMDIEDMVSTCVGLVKINKWDATVALIHYTTEEYLRRTWPTWANTYLNADMVIATTCLTYLLFPVFDVEFSEMDQLSQSKGTGRHVFPLLEYSLKHGGLHARVAGTNCLAIDRFCSSDSKVSKTWLLLNAKYGEGQGEGTAEWLIEQGVTASVRDSEGRTAFHYAVLNGWARCVEYLLKREAMMDTDVKNMTPLHYAVSTGNEAIVKVFLGAGIPVDMPVTRQLHTSPCQENKAIYVTRDNGQIVLDDSCSEQGLTPLHLAAMTGSQKNDEVPSGSRWHNTNNFWNDPDNRVECVLEWIDPEEEEEDNYYSTEAWIRKGRMLFITS
ncbi:hypothetical protein FCIRC_3890 [Fusarium circinatum]|uniref:Ankyrin repeat protein n=1 Tax=Fusarium circinatum TaxID=48490 RepID=A0A8H5UE49_FUSCI|nr:hypothetical protein FCIRC_3890 [Fusarium circinatum]